MIQPTNWLSLHMCAVLVQTQCVNVKTRKCNAPVKTFSTASWSPTHATVNICILLGPCMAHLVSTGYFSTYMPVLLVLLCQNRSGSGPVAQYTANDASCMQRPCDMSSAHKLSGCFSLPNKFDGEASSAHITVF